MEVMVSVCAENPAAGRVFECGDAFATVVLVDAAGAPLPVPCELDLPSDPADPDARRAAGAAGRREARLAERRAITDKDARRPSLDGTRAPGAGAAAARAAAARFLDAAP
jgi:acyl-CoA hydrolase